MSFPIGSAALVARRVLMTLPLGLAVATSPVAADFEDQLHRLLPSGSADDEFGAGVGLGEFFVTVGSPGDDRAGEDAGAVYVFERGTGELARVLLADDAAAGARFGGAVSVRSGRVLVGAAAHDGVGVDAGAAYLFDLRSGQQLQRFVPDDAAASDFFGIAVALGADRVVIGTPFKDGAGTNTGSAYLFDSETGTQIAALVPGVLAPFDQYGWRVAIGGGRVLVSSVRDDASAGVVYMFDADDGMLLDTLVADDSGPDLGFGSSLAVSGDMAAIGATGADGQAGAVYLFDLSTGLQVRRITAADPDPGDAFGSTVALQGTTLLVGTSLDDGGGVNAGAAYLFDAATGDQLAKLAPGDLAEGDGFGISVALGSGLAVVGSWWDDDFGAFTGAAYVFDASSHVELAKLRPGDGAAFDRFGASVALTSTRFVVGAPESDRAGTNSGGAWTYDAATGEPTGPLVPLQGSAEDWFGVSVAARSGLAVVGASGHDHVAPEAGAAFVFDLGSRQQLVRLLPFAGAADSRFGFSVGIGAGFVAVGAPLDDEAALDGGAAYAFPIGGGPGTKIAPVALAPGDAFGHAVATAGDRIVTGAPFHAGTGAVWAHDAVTGAESAMLLPADGGPGDEYGAAVAIADDVVVVGAPLHDAAGTNAGAAYLHDAVTGELLAKLLAPVPAAGDRFGTAVAIAGGVVVVGAPGDGDAAANAGAAHAYDAASGLFLGSFRPSDAEAEALVGASVAVRAGRALVGGPGRTVHGTESGAAWVFDADAPAVCPGDIAAPADGEVGFDDLLGLLACWGVGGADCDAADLALPADGTVDFSDLLVLLAAWGPCP